MNGRSGGSEPAGSVLAGLGLAGALLAVVATFTPIIKIQVLTVTPATFSGYDRQLSRERTRMSAPDAERRPTIAAAGRPTEPERAAVAARHWGSMLAGLGLAGAVLGIVATFSPSSRSRCSP